MWLAKLAGHPIESAHRVTWMAPRFDPLLATAADKGWRIYFLAGTPDVNRKALAILRHRFPSLALEGHRGYLGTSDVRQQIRDFEPDLLIVGMGMPRQEQWVLEHRKSLEIPVIATAGACLDYIAGAEPIPPRWLGAWGLRVGPKLAMDPGRLWRRYLLEPWAVLLFLVIRAVRGDSGLQ